MLFKRRSRQSRKEKLRKWFWPRRSFTRSFRYYGKRLLRLRSNPHAIAIGAASGIFASCLPYLGLHFLVAAGLAWVLRGNVAASAIGTAFGNPVTFPFIWALTLESGRFILDPHPVMPSDLAPAIGIGERLATFNFSLLWDPLLKPMTVGGLFWGIIFALIGYFVVRYVVASFQRVRRQRQFQRQAQRLAQLRSQGQAGENCLNSHNARAAN